MPLLAAAALASTLVGAAHPGDFGSPTTAFSGSPVRVQACTLDQLPIPSAGDMTVNAGSTPLLQISFVNQAGVPATDVRFTLRAGGQTEQLDQRGTFSTGTTIVKNFDPSINGDGAQCTIDAVSFSDGSTWQR